MSVCATASGKLRQRATAGARFHSAEQETRSHACDGNDLQIFHSTFTEALEYCVRVLRTRAMRAFAMHPSRAPLCFCTALHAPFSQLERNRPTHASWGMDRRISWPNASETRLETYLKQRMLPPLLSAHAPGLQASLRTSAPCPCTPRALSEPFDKSLLT